jgi:6-phosphogluconolactonase (cycloisomerase 2 family)
MRHFVTLHAKSICLISAFCTTAAFAQMTFAQTSTSSPVAFVYVSSNPNNSSTNQINAFAATANGKLTPVPGSPFRDDVTSMAVNGKYLFGSTRNGIYVAAFSIAQDGALRWKASTDIVKYNQGDCGASGPLFLDHTGQSLYDMEFRSDCSNNSYQSLAVNKFTGRLHNLGATFGDAWLNLPASFIGNNVYAYTAVCLSNMYWEVAGFKRSPSGSLSQIQIKAPIPAAKQGDFWCPSQAAADPTNHLAITLQAVNQDFNPDGPPQLATYTADTAGNLSTTSTLANMPQTSVGTVTDLKMAPSGKLLAVAGTSGLQVFHFNGSNPVTHDTGLLTKNQIDQMFWDSNNHLYAISQSAGKLFVFTITPTSVNQASGSPYAIAHPQNIAVQPKAPTL